MYDIMVNYKNIIWSNYNIPNIKLTCVDTTRNTSACEIIWLIIWFKIKCTRWLLTVAVIIYNTILMSIISVMVTPVKIMHKLQKEGLTILS